MSAVNAPAKVSSRPVGPIAAAATLGGTRFLRIDVTVEAWRFGVVVDSSAPSGLIRDLASTINLTTGVDYRAALVAILAAVNAPPVAA